MLTLEHNTIKNPGEILRLAAENPEKMEEFHKDLMDTAKIVTFSPDGKTLAVLRQNGLIRLWDIETQKIIHTFTGHRWDVYTIAFAPNGKTLASGGHDGTILLWNVP